MIGDDVTEVRPALTLARISELTAEDARHHVVIEGHGWGPGDVLGREVRSQEDRDRADALAHLAIVPMVDRDPL
jgi:hypothetical protein